MGYAVHVVTPKGLFWNWRTMFFFQLSNHFVIPLYILERFLHLCFCICMMKFLRAIFFNKPDAACLTSLSDFHYSKKLCLLCRCWPQPWLRMKSVSVLESHMHPVLNSSFVTQWWLSGFRLSHWYLHSLYLVIILA